MFGYIKPYKSELKLREYEIFRAYYCGLCKSLGRNYGQLVRLGLNYDLAFLGLVLSSLNPERDEFKAESCISSPIKKKKIVRENLALKYTSGISVILIYFKCLDDWRDERSIKALIANLPYGFSVRKAKIRYSKHYGEIEEKLELLAKLEGENCAVVDQVADVFGKLMQAIAQPEFIEDENTRKILGVLGYNLGRWIYIMDAFQDIEEDIDSKSYNPILLQYEYREEEALDDFLRRVRPKVEFSLVFTLDNIAKSFELLDLKHNRAIVENIVYMGMRSKLENVLMKGVQ